MVRESKTTERNFSSTGKVPVGVSYPGLPMDAGTDRATAPLMLTVKVCADMSASATTPALVRNSVRALPTCTEIGARAGRKLVGVQVSSRSFAQDKAPGSGSV